MGGHRRRPDRGGPWEEDTLVLVYSTTKGVTAMCANRLAQQGAIDVEAPVATYWPEFAQAGKEKVTVADLLSHRAGLAWVDGTMSFEDMVRWDPVVEALERQAPSWPPGTAHGYHATTYGWLVGEVVRRVTGMSIGTYLRTEIAGPLRGRLLHRSARLRGAPGGPARVVHRGAQVGPPADRSEPDEATPGAGPDLAELAELAKTYFAPERPPVQGAVRPRRGP